MNQLKINIPEGFKIKSFDQSTGEVNFEPLPRDIKERIKTFEDVLKEKNMTLEYFNDINEELLPDEIAYRKIKLIAEVLNEGWIPDWSDDDEYKYYPWFKMGSPSGVGFSYYYCVRWLTFSIVGSRLCFKSRELAEYAGKQFTDIYKDFLTLNNQ
ncbi:hypothetical protein [Myroides odoratimimus]|uniref:hypothetical protein n=1 Tax=Myroides odoratimimus TaxID=76832 RepID=UPI00257588EB|nr:hypothetical protein [Myroides odoratimimus]MDM1093399.1 hypothetical protein [Myroides odoratimimus]